jgi:hypothetical protein
MKSQRKLVMNYSLISHTQNLKIEFLEIGEEFDDE